MMFGMMGQFLPAAAAALVATNPVLIGAGAVFGSVQLLDDRKRKVTMRRQTARQQVRQFIDDVQFEVGNEINGLMREAQRELRDEFTERLKELQRTYTETAQRAQADAKRTQEEVASRRSHVEDSLARLDAIELMLNGGGAS